VGIWSPPEGVFDAVLTVLIFLAVAAITTAVSLRLLGIRRGWGSALLSGVLGWGIGAAVALALAD
jgi:hypothetical protein